MQTTARIVSTLCCVLSVVAIAPCASQGAQSEPKFFRLPFDPRKNTIKIRPREKWSLFREGDPILIQTVGSARVRVFGLRDETIYEGPPGGLPKLAVGHYFVETRGDRSQFAVLPADYRGSNWMGTEAWDGKHPLWAEQLDAIRPHWARTMVTGCEWAAVQPNVNTWQWSDCDSTIGANHRLGRNILFQAYERPAWLVEDAEFIPRYCEYLRRAAARYRGKLYGIEIWNEPHWGPNWPRNYSSRLPYCHRLEDVPESYFAVLKSGWTAIRGVDESVKVFAACPSLDMPNQVKRLAGLGAGRYMDGLAWHDYWSGLIAPDVGGDYPLGYKVERLDKLCQSFRAEFPGKILVMNEGGLYGQSALGVPNRGKTNPLLFLSPANWRRGMCRAIKLTVMYAAEGVEAIIPHVLPNPPSDLDDTHEISGWEYGPRGPHPKTSAFLMTAYWLDGAQLIDKRIVNNMLFLYAWQRPNGKSVVFAWCVEGKSMKLLPARRTRPTDIYGRAVETKNLGEEPLLFHDTAMDEVAARLKG